MSDLHEAIKTAITSNLDYRERTAYEGEDAWREGWWEWDKAVDAILAAFHDAMTSDAVLSKAASFAETVWHEEQPHIGWLNLQYMVISTALAAAGVTKGDE